MPELNRVGTEMQAIPCARGARFDSWRNTGEALIRPSRAKTAISIDLRRKIGFTGTRRGMTPTQRAELTRLLSELAPAEVHHGGAIGADAEFHEIALALGIPRIVVHPSSLAEPSADIRLADVRSAVIVLPPRKPLRRNRAIAREAEVLIAAPATAEEIERSGTWSTVRFTRRCLPTVRVVVLPPS